jgi:hypothetical protein
MTILARRIKAIPERSAVDAWRMIMELVASSPSTVRSELESISGIASSIITDEGMISINPGN